MMSRLLEFPAVELSDDMLHVIEQREHRLIVLQELRNLRHRIRIMADMNLITPDVESMLIDTLRQAAEACSVKLFIADLTEERS